MTASLTTLISRVQALLLDSGTNYSTATVTAAIRQALKEYNQAAPIHAGTLVEIVSGQYEYELEDPDFTGLIEITSVKLEDPSGGEQDTDLEYTHYFEDNRPFIRLKEAQSSGFLVVRYTLPNTINGLDSAAESTVPDYFDQVLTDGGAYYSICVRSVGRVESINLNKDVPDNLREAASAYKLAFEFGKIEAGRRKGPPAKSDPTWNFEPTGF